MSSISAGNRIVPSEQQNMTPSGSGNVKKLIANFATHAISIGGTLTEVTKKTVAVAKEGIERGAASEKTAESKGPVQKKEDYYGESHMLMNEMVEIEQKMDDVSDSRLEQLKENCHKMWRKGKELLGSEKGSVYDETVANYQERLAEMIMTLSEKLDSRKPITSPLTPSGESENELSTEGSTLNSPTSPRFSSSMRTPSTSSDDVKIENEDEALVTEQNRRQSIVDRLRRIGAKII